ncbi:histone H1 [Bacteroides uniformis]|mgnify:FL=1|uniref:histone H1 n=1 Tax=Bacteroides uniformis TaxID=820 RepID=UPI0039786891
MKELLEKMQDTYETFKANAMLQLEKQNKAAGTRARKDSLILEKLAKEFRKASLEASKK